jgi:hypothetical protein
MPVLYFGGRVEVNIGDRVMIRLWFRKRPGRIVYIPGKSDVNPEFEYRGMRWVGVRLNEGALVATPVLTKTGGLKKKVEFIGRDDSPCDVIKADTREFEKRDEGPAF